MVAKELVRRGSIWNVFESAFAELLTDGMEEGGEQKDYDTS